MSHVVYHSKYKSMVVNSADYVALLSTGEWFDNPNLDPGGTENEIKRYEQEIEEQKSEYQCVRCGSRAWHKNKIEPRHKDKESQQLDDAKRESSEGLKPDSNLEDAKPPAQKRGRPRKK